jgi:hypothetical protein
MRWIRPTSRLAIYLRDGMACAWCGFAIEDGAVLTLDHCKPRIKGGTNEPSNLVTSCVKCNCSRQDRSMSSFAKSVSKYSMSNTKDIINHIAVTRKQDLRGYRKEARDLMKRRGNVGTTLESAIAQM